MLAFSQAERSLENHVFSLEEKCPISAKQVDVKEKNNEAIFKNAYF